MGTVREVRIKCTYSRRSLYLLYTDVTLTESATPVNAVQKSEKIIQWDEFESETEEPTQRPDQFLSLPKQPVKDMLPNPEGGNVVTALDK